MKLKSFCLITISILAFLAITFADYKNLATSLIDVKNINTDLLAITTNVLLVIILYIITYYYVEKYNEKEKEEALKNETQISENKLSRERNTKDITDLLIKKCFENMLIEIQNMDNTKYLDTLANKIDFNIPLINDKIYQRIISNVFTHMDTIVEMSLKGYVSMNVFDDLLAAESNFRSYINLRITFFDIEKSDDVRSAEMQKTMNNLKGKVTGIIERGMN